MINKYSALPSLFEIMPSRVQDIVDDLNQEFSYQKNEDLKVVHLYWLYTFNNMYLFKDPELIKSDVRSGLRQMISRTFLNGRQKATRSHLKIVRKIYSDKEWELEMLSSISWVLQTQPIMKTLQHATLIPFTLIDLIREHLKGVSFDLSESAYIKNILLEAGSTNRNEVQEKMAAIDLLVVDTLRMVNKLPEKEFVKNRLISAKNLEELKNIHDSIVVDFNDYSYQLSLTDNFPPPPFAGNQNIVPIENEADLRIEGRLMKHCVGSYADLVKKQETYIYKVLSPERATLAIDLNTGTIREFKLACNQHPSRESFACVREWLSVVHLLGPSIGDNDSNLKY